MKRDKAHEWRMEGMGYALKIAKEQGVEGLAKDLRNRRVTGIHLAMNQKDMDRLFSYVNENVYVNMICCVLWTLHERFGYGKKRLQDFKEAYDKTVDDVTSLDWMGEHYVRMEDYAVELNGKYDLGLDAIKTAAMSAIVDDSREDVRNRRFLKHIDEVLKRGGFTEAAEYLTKYERGRDDGKEDV